MTNPFEVDEEKDNASRHNDTTDEGAEIQIGSITLQVVPGDITQETTDAIVNGTNSRLDFTSSRYIIFLCYL